MTYRIQGFSFRPDPDNPIIEAVVGEGPDGRDFHAAFDADGKLSGVRNLGAPYENGIHPWSRFVDKGAFSRVDPEERGVDVPSLDDAHELLALIELHQQLHVR